MTTIRPLRDTVMFEFLDVTIGSKGAFVPANHGGRIALVAAESVQKINRWGRVLAAGPKAEVNVGDYILVEGLMWMEGTVIDGVKMWKTDDSKIIVSTNDRESCQNQF